MNKKDYCITILPQCNGGNMISELVRYKDLILLYASRNFKLIYKQTILGPLWILLNPLLTSFVFTFIFGMVANIKTDGIPNFLFYLSGNILWTLFSTNVIEIANTFISNVHIFGKVYFPRLAIPIATLVTGIINFCVQLALLLIFCVFYWFNGFSFSLDYKIILLPILILETTFLSLGVGLIIASLTAKYRDLKIAINFCMQLWMYCSPIVYPLSNVGKTASVLILINPMASIINNFRNILFGAGNFIVVPWMFSILISIILLIAGVKVFELTQRNFMDTI